VACRYLLAKYKGCVNGECRFLCDRGEVEAVLRTVLPPVSSKELTREIDSTMRKMPGDSIYLDCLQSFYFLREKLLDDSDFDSLKDMLTWEGSSAATLSGKEARFISGVAAFRRGSPIMGDDEYEKLKTELQVQQSWVVMRMQDPLEKLGIETFIGYLHRQMGPE
jgi:hypothetical protein